MNNTPIKISLKSNNLDYCRIQRDKILERLKLNQEEELLNNILKDLELFKKKELLHNKLDLGSFTYNKEDEKKEKIRKEKRAERIKKEFDNKIENVEKIKILKKENNLDKQFQSLEERLLQKLQIQQTLEEKPTTSLKIDLKLQFEKYLQHKEKHEKISKSSLKAYAATYRYLEYFTTKNTIFNFAFFKEVQQKLQQLPKDFFKHERYYKSTFEQVLKLQKKEQCETLNAKTINNHISNFKTFFEYLIYEEIIKENPLSNIKPLQEQKETPKEEYTMQELESIFTSDLEQDFKNMCKVALYTGLRIEEVLSIKKEDIKDNLIHLNLEDKSTKKHQRVIPIHKNLLTTIQSQIKANKGNYLFFEGHENNGARNIGKRINRRLKNIIESEFKTFHSLRKNFSQEIELNTTSEEKIKKYLMGHSMSKDVTHMVYNRGKMNIEKLEDCINQITFTY